MDTRINDLGPLLSRRQHNPDQRRFMKTKVVSTSTFLLIAFAATAANAQSVSWKHIVGIIPAGNVVGSGTGQVMGGFLPWSTTSGHAHVNLRTADIEFVVRGLVFAGGSPNITIGTPLPVTAVKGTLVCDNDGSAGGGNSVIVETPSVPLTATGDARFSGNIGPLPAVCSSEPDIVFLVRASAFSGTPTEGPWIANGAVLSRDSDDSK
jgi:hypothetical protein